MNFVETFSTLYWVYK